MKLKESSNLVWSEENREKDMINAISLFLPIAKSWASLNLKLEV
jgi:hypothetical protein